MNQKYPLPPLNIIHMCPTQYKSHVYQSKGERLNHMFWAHCYYGNMVTYRGTQRGSPELYT